MYRYKREKIERDKKERRARYIKWKEKTRKGAEMRKR